MSRPRRSSSGRRQARECSLRRWATGWAPERIAARLSISATRGGATCPPRASLAPSSRGASDAWSEWWHAKRWPAAGLFPWRSPGSSSGGSRRPVARERGDELLVRHPEPDVVLRHGRAPAGSLVAGHRAERLVAALVVVLVLEEDEHQRLFGIGIVKRDDFLGGNVVRALAARDLSLHLGHPFAADAFEGHDSCERHSCLLVEGSSDSKPSGRKAQARARSA